MMKQTGEKMPNNKMSVNECKLFKKEWEIWTGIVMTGLRRRRRNGLMPEKNGTRQYVTAYKDGIDVSGRRFT